MDTASARVAIVGAGMAGLACAQHLRDAGQRVSVFDAGGTPGGRMGTFRTRDWQADYGAQYFTAREPAFAREVARWEAAGVAERWHARLAVLRGAPAQRTEVLDSDDTVRFVGVPAMHTPALWLTSGLTVHSRVTVRHIRHDAAGWRLTSEEHGVHREHYDALVLALPGAQAAPLLEPLLPLTAQLARAAVMQPCWSLVVRMNQAWNPGYDGAFVEGGALGWIARDRGKPERQGDEVWVLHATPEWSAQHLACTREQVTGPLLAALRALGAPEITAVLSHLWHHARVVPGANPYLSPGQRAQWIPAVQVGLCGDWFGAGRIEDAWLSGRTLAASVINSLRGDDGLSDSLPGRSGNRGRSRASVLPVG